MYGRKSWLGLFLVLSLCSVTSVATAQEKEITGYVLYKVLTGHGPATLAKSPRLVEADASGRFAVPYEVRVGARRVK